MMLRNKSLRGKKVGVLAGDGFEYVELAVPRRALRKAGAKVDVISLHSGKIRGMNMTEPTTTVAVDRTVDEVSPDEYDALLIPGGFIGPDMVRQSRQAREFVKAFDAEEKPIATLCHGPWVLVSADLVSGRSLSSWPGVRDDVVNAGGNWRDSPVVRDGNWVSSRGPQDLREFVPAMLSLFAGEEPAASAEEGGNVSGERDGSPVRRSSPQPNHPPLAAVAAARVLPGPTFRTFALLAALVGVAALAFRRWD